MKHGGRRREGERQRKRIRIKQREREREKGAREGEMGGWGGSSSIWCHAAINKLYEKTGDVYLIMEYLRNRNETHTLSHYC